MATTATTATTAMDYDVDDDNDNSIIPTVAPPPGTVVLRYSREKLLSLRGRGSSIGNDDENDGPPGCLVDLADDVIVSRTAQDPGECWGKRKKQTRVVSYARRTRTLPPFVVVFVVVVFFAHPFPNDIGENVNIMIDLFSCMYSSYLSPPLQHAISIYLSLVTPSKISKFVGIRSTPTKYGPPSPPVGEEIGWEEVSEGLGEANVTAPFPITTSSARDRSGGWEEED